jgi:hypothetical protein
MQIPHTCFWHHHIHQGPVQLARVWASFIRRHRRVLSGPDVSVLESGDAEQIRYECNSFGIVSFLQRLCCLWPQLHNEHYEAYMNPCTL